MTFQPVLEAVALEARGCENENQSTQKRKHVHARIHEEQVNAVCGVGH